MFTEFFDDFALGDEELAGFEVGASAGGIFPGFLGEAGERIINPEVFRGVFRGGFQELAEEDGSVAAIAAELNKVACVRVVSKSLRGKAKDFGGFGGGDLIVAHYR